MRKYLILFVVLVIIVNIASYAQPIGFVQPECGLLSNPHYSFKNYQYGSIGNGYVIYHNDKEIFRKEDFIYGFKGMKIEFIDDTTGFFLDRAFEYNIFTIYKIINDSVILTGTSVGKPYDWFIASDWFITSRHSVFLITTTESNFLINHVSDLQPAKVLFYGMQITSDTTFFDTVKGQTLCQDLDALNYKFKSVEDTLTYTIKFMVDTLSFLNDTKNPIFKVFPNPATNYFHLRSTECEPLLISIFDISGNQKKSISSGGSYDNLIFIGDLNKGIYIVKIRDKSFYKVFKIFKF